MKIKIKENEEKGTYSFFVTGHGDELEGVIDFEIADSAFGKTLNLNIEEGNYEVEGIVDYYPG